MQDLCIVSFKIEPLSGDSSARSIVPIVNGDRLTALIEEFEREHRYEPIGGYAGIVPAHFNAGPLDGYFMGSSPTSSLQDRHCYLLGCGCGEAGCWPLEAQILTHEKEVVWTGFTQPFRPERDYTSFGPFQFDLYQYKQAIGELVSAFQGA